LAAPISPVITKFDNDATPDSLTLWCGGLACTHIQPAAFRSMWGKPGLMVSRLASSHRPLKGTCPKLSGRTPRVGRHFSELIQIDMLVDRGILAPQSSERLRS